MKNEKSKLKRPKHFRHNAKATIIFCFNNHCLSYKYVLRNDAKFCCDLCRLHEFSFRKEIGYTKLLIKGSKEDLKKFYWGYAPIMQPNPLKDDYVRILNVIDRIDMTKSWKEVFDGFLVYHFPNRTKAPFEVYADLKKFGIGDSFKKRCLPRVKQTFKYVG